MLHGLLPDDVMGVQLYFSYMCYLALHCTVRTTFGCVFGRTCGQELLFLVVASFTGPDMQIYRALQYMLKTVNRNREKENT